MNAVIARQICGIKMHHSRWRLSAFSMKLVKALDMLPRNPVFLLLTANLLAVPYLNPSILPAVGPASEGIQYSSSIVSQQNSNGAKYTLSGTVVNSVSGEPVRGALVQIYFNGQSSMLTGPDGKFQFDDLPAGFSTINVRKPGFFAEGDLRPSERGQLQVTTGPNSPPVVLKLIPEGIVYGRISEEDGEPIEELPVELLVQRL
jgi:Carboxypeptidase regulatory-like domain